jgi:hypothetical protein
LLLASGNSPVAVALGEELEDDESIGAATEEFDGTEGNTEAWPDAQRRVGGGGAPRNDSDSFADKVMSELTSWWHSGDACANSVAAGSGN